MRTIEYRGISGKFHRFSAHRPDDVFSAAAAVYCFARPSADGTGLTPIFLSRTGNLALRLATHELWGEARLLGATHVLVHQRDERDAREFVEADLFEALRPIMNGPVLDADLIEEATPAGPRLVWAA
jgi:hypothetical protein